jgi:MATE family multidrug resistance protein
MQTDSPAPEATGLAWPNAASTRQLLRLAWPLLLSNSFLTLQIVLDRLLLSNSSSEAVGAGLSGALMFWTVLGLLQYTANYATTFVAQYTGAKEFHRTGLVVGQALWFSVVAGLLFPLFAPFTGLLAGLTHHSPELQRLEAVYLFYLCFAALPALLTASACSFFAGIGDSRTVLLVNASGLTVNGLSAWLLIFGRFGLPEMGIAGAGIATILGSATSAVLSLSLFLRSDYRISHSTGEFWRFDPALFARLMRFGVPNGVFVSLETLAYTVFLIMVGWLGTIDLAATSVAFTLNLIAFMPVLGIGQAVEILVGQKLGENRPDEAERATWTGLAASLALTFLVALLYLSIPHTLALPFQSKHDPENWAQISVLVPILLRFVIVYCLFDTVQIVLSNALRGAGDTTFVTAVSLSLAWPLMVLPTGLALRAGWGLYWAWGFSTLYIVLLALIFLWRFLQGRWRSMRVIESPAPREEPSEPTQPADTRTQGGQDASVTPFPEATQGG